MSIVLCRCLLIVCCWDCGSRGWRNHKNSSVSLTYIIAYTLSVFLKIISSKSSERFLFFNPHLQKSQKQIDKNLISECPVLKRDDEQQKKVAGSKGI